MLGHRGLARASLFEKRLQLASPSSSNTSTGRRATDDARSALDIVTTMGDMDLSTGSTMQLYHGDVGLQPVLQIAGACWRYSILCFPKRASLRRDGARGVTFLVREPPSRARLPIQ
jgi:hypothetical protein